MSCIYSINSQHLFIMLFTAVTLNQSRPSICKLINYRNRNHAHTLTSEDWGRPNRTDDSCVKAQAAADDSFWVFIVWVFIKYLVPACLSCECGFRGRKHGLDGCLIWLWKCQMNVCWNTGIELDWTRDLCHQQQKLWETFSPVTVRNVEGVNKTTRWKIILAVKDSKSAND